MSLVSWKGHALCAVDVETSGTLPGYHEIVQIACVPLNQHMEPHPELRHFYMDIKPDFPERMNPEAVKKHGLTVDYLDQCVSQDRAVDLFIEWFESLGLLFGKRLLPLAHNWAFERGFLMYWLGLEGFDSMWQGTGRDTMTAAGFINDLYVWHGRKHPFNYVNLKAICDRFDIHLDKAHDALADCLATAKLYAEYMRFLGGQA